MSRITVILVAACHTGWEVRQGEQVLYWGTSLDRSVREARRAVDWFENAVVVVEGGLAPVLPSDEPRRGTGGTQP